MLEHHIQKSLIKQLAFSENGMRFSELQPDGVENKLFNYHLKIVLRDGLVEKNSAGNYKLTSEGRRLGLRAFRLNDYTLSAFSVLFLAVRRKESNEWLLYKRKAHPLIDKVGFMHAVPIPEETVSETATRELKQKTGLSGTFSHAGSGYFKMYENSELESYTHFDLMSCIDANGNLEQLHQNAEYYWDDDPDFSSDQMIPNMKTLVDHLNLEDNFFIDKSIKY